MKQLIALLFLALAVVSAPLVAADDVAKTPAAAKSAAGVKSMDPAKGRFHQTHTKKLKMACTTCHSSEVKDALFLRKNDVVPAGMPGQVDRSVCLGCHQEPAKPAWYGTAAR